MRKLKSQSLVFVALLGVSGIGAGTALADGPDAKTDQLAADVACVSGYAHGVQVCASPELPAMLEPASNKALCVSGYGGAALDCSLPETPRVPVSGAEG
jgi:hypothetical protein